MIKSFSSMIKDALERTVMKRPKIIASSTFGLTKASLATVVSQLKPCSTDEFLDVYYDTKEFSLTRTNRWLRSRQQELKTTQWTLQESSKDTQWQHMIYSGETNIMERLGDLKLFGDSPITVCPNRLTAMYTRRYHFAGGGSLKRWYVDVTYLSEELLYIIGTAEWDYPVNNETDFYTDVWDNLTLIHPVADKVIVSLIRSHPGLLQPRHIPFIIHETIKLDMMVTSDPFGGVLPEDMIPNLKTD